MNVSVWRWETGTKTRRPVLQSPPTTTLHFSKKKKNWHSKASAVGSTVLEGRRWTFATDEPSLLSQLSRLHGVRAKKTQDPSPCCRRSNTVSSVPRLYTNEFEMTFSTSVATLMYYYSVLCIQNFWVLSGCTATKTRTTHRIITVFFFFFYSIASTLPRWKKMTFFKRAGFFFLTEVISFLINSWLSEAEPRPRQFIDDINAVDEGQEDVTRADVQPASHPAYSRTSPDKYLSFRIH